MPPGGGLETLIGTSQARPASEELIRHSADHDLSAADNLSSIAEVAIALAGFAALVGVLGRRSGRAKEREIGLRLLFGLEASLLVVAAALLPTVPLSFGLSGEQVWRGSAFLYLLADLTLSYMIARRSRPLEIPAVAQPGMSRAIWTVSALGQLLLVIALLGFFASHTPAVYLTVLYLNLVNSGLAFLVVAWDTFVGDESSP